MLPLAWLLLATVTLAQDSGFNIYKDLQRGRVDELERLLTNEETAAAMDNTHQIDHSAYTWPSMVARVQLPNSAKRTINRFKAQRAGLDDSKDSQREDEVEVDSTISEDEGDGDGEVVSRVLIPRTHVLLREVPGKLKRGAVVWVTSSSLIRNLNWLLRAGAGQFHHRFGYGYVHGHNHNPNRNR